MRKLLLLVPAIFIIHFTSTAQNIICVQSGSNATFYTDVQTAIDAAQDGDYIYLPGGIISNGFTINKRLYIYGAGHYPDSSLATQPTIISGYINFVQGADNSTLTGVKAGTISIGNSDTDNDVNNCSIIRCYASAVVLTWGVNNNWGSMVNGFLIEHSVINYLNLAQAIGVTIKNSIISSIYYCTYANNGLNIENCLFLNSGVVLNQIYYATLKNCIFKDTYYAYNSGAMADNNYLQNNLFAYTPNFGTNDVYLSNIVNPNLGLVNSPSSSFSYTDNYHLLPNSPAVGTGAGGTDIGIYGGNRPYKEGAVPINPHIQTQTINGATDGLGNLPVNIKVAAQTY